MDSAKQGGSELSVFAVASESGCYTGRDFCSNAEALIQPLRLVPPRQLVFVDYCIGGLPRNSDGPSGRRPDRQQIFA